MCRLLVQTVDEVVLCRPRLVGFPDGDRGKGTLFYSHEPVRGMYQVQLECKDRRTRGRRGGGPRGARTTAEALRMRDVGNGQGTDGQCDDGSGSGAKRNGVTHGMSLEYGARSRRAGQRAPGPPRLRRPVVFS